MSKVTPSEPLPPNGVPTQPVPLQDAQTSLPTNLNSLQYLRVPSRPASNRSSRHGSAHLPTKVPIPHYTLRQFPPGGTAAVVDAHKAHAPLTPSRQCPNTLPSEVVPDPPTMTAESGTDDGARPPTAPATTTATSRNASANIPRSLFHPSVDHKRGLETDVSWVGDSPRLSSSSKRHPPPLVAALEHHLSRELASIAEASGGSGGDDVDPLQALHAHREVLRMLAEGMPSYAGILNGAVVAFERALKHQAVFAAEARAISHAAEQVRNAHDAEVAELNRALAASQAKYTDMHDSLLAKLNEARANASQGVIGSLKQETQFLRQSLAEAEADKFADLERIMTLIAAVKECDNRVKNLEDQLQEAHRQLDDMNSLKKMMAESQAELGQLKFNYKDCVSLSRFQNTTHELQMHLKEAKEETSRVRRLCISRGSIIDGLQKKLKAATDEIETYRAAVGSKTIRDALTPRPDWLAIHEQLPDLKDAAKDLPQLLLDGAEPVRFTAGTNETTLQVQYLVDRVLELQTTGGSRAAATSPLPQQPPVGTSSEHAALQPTPSLSGAAKFRGSSLPPSLTTKASIAAAPLYSQIVALGCGPNVPAYFREVGVVPRIFLENSKVRELLHEFFSGPVRQKSGSTVSVADLSRYLLMFCQDQFSRNTELRTRCHGIPQYLVYNLAEGMSSLPQQVLFRHILHGTMPIQLVFHALEVEDHVRHELQALCQAHNKSRLRRVTVLELLVPLLSFKSREEMEELRTVLGVEQSVDVASLTQPTSKLMETLFEQECSEGIRLYTTILEKLTQASVLGEDGVRRITTSLVLGIIADVEPRTPQHVIDALICGDAADEETFSLEHAIAALATTPLVRLSSGTKAAPDA